MGYFIGVPNQNIPGSGNTVSDEGTLTADLIATSTSEVAIVAPVMIFAPAAIAEETANTAQVDFGVYATRECISECSPEEAIIDIGIVSGAGTIKIYDETTQLSAQVDTLRFKGSDVIAMVGESNNIVNVFVPPVMFAPTFTLTVVGGPFNGLSVVEKGFQPSAVSLAFTSNDNTNFPLTSYTNLQLNGAGVALDAGSTVNGGTYTAAMSEPVAFTVTLNSNSYTSNKAAALTFNSKYYNFKSLTASGMDETTIEAGSGVLASARGGSKSFGTSGTPEYLWVCYPQSFGNATSFVNPANNFAVPFEAPEVVSVTNTYGYTQNYLCYRSTNQTAGAITVTVS